MKSVTAVQSQSSSPAIALRKLKAACSGEAVMQLSAALIAGLVALAALVVLLLILGVNFRPPVTAHGAALYNPATEVVVRGSIERVLDFTCPVSEGEMGSHLMLKTPDGIVQVHLAPGRIMRSQHLSFAPGDRILVVGSKVRILGSNDLIAREITRGQEDFVFRDRAGNLLLVQ